MSKILAYGCTSSAGPTTLDFWNGLCEGRNHCSPTGLWKVADSSVCQTLVLQMMTAWQQTLEGLSPSRRERIKNDKNLGVIFASTKGAVEDYIWKDSFSENATDPLTPVLDQFIKAAEITTENSLSVSNACSSSVGALFLAQEWLKHGRVENVLVIAADKIGPFVTQGFKALKALASNKSKPFSFDRDGLQLGEAAAAFLLTNDEINEPHFLLNGIAIDTEGFAITRPSHLGASLNKVCREALKTHTPDLIIAHGTGTRTNDEIEDQVFSNLFKNQVPVTSTKWSIGHTLGASASMDLIAACECIRNQKAFHIANTDQIDPSFSAHYLVGKISPKAMTLNKVLVTSLGFGGVHGALLVEGVAR